MTFINRIVIKLDDLGQLDSVSSDAPCRVFILDESAVKEPVYELNHDVGVNYVSAMLKDNLAATGDSTGPWKNTKPFLGEIK